jgi:hypothetical protein
MSLGDALHGSVAPPTVDQLAESAIAAHGTAEARLTALRAERDGLNEQIAAAVIDERRARRMANAARRSSE